MAVDPLIGYSLAGKWQIAEFLREEQLGRVYRAESTKGDLVSIKVLHPHLLENEEVSTRFEREMLATAAVEHPNTVQMIDFGEHRVFRYIVLEYLLANTLTDVLAATGGRLPFDRVAHISAQIASAMTVAHAQNIIHRNLNPDNILLLENARGDYVKVRDFGLSWLEEGPAGAGAMLTAVGTRVGATAYMAPEYIQMNLVDPRGDLYGLGCMMFEMVAGQTPFVGKGGDILTKHCTDPPPILKEVVPDTPQWLSDLVDQLLAKSPDERPGTQDVVDYLESQMGQTLGPPQVTDVRQYTADAPKKAPAKTMPIPDEDEGGSGGLVLQIGLGIAAVLLLGTLAVLLIAIVGLIVGM